MVKAQNIRNTKLVTWNQTVEWVISTLEQNPWEAGCFLDETFIIVNNFVAHLACSQKLTIYTLVTQLNPLQYYSPRHLKVCYICAF